VGGADTPERALELAAELERYMPVRVQDDDW
jgi:hypothetical protein